MYDHTTKLLPKLERRMLISYLTHKNTLAKFRILLYTNARPKIDPSKMYVHIEKPKLNFYKRRFWCHYMTVLMSLHDSFDVITWQFWCHYMTVYQVQWPFSAMLLTQERRRAVNIVLSLEAYDQNNFLFQCKIAKMQHIFGHKCSE